MRIATYNVEWFDALFDRNANPLIDHKWSSRYNVTRADQWHAVGQVMRAIDADCILVVEAPNHKTGRGTVDMLERFAVEFGLRAAQAALGFINDTQQELAFLYDPHRCSIRHVPMSAPDFPRFGGTYAIDLDVDAVTDPIRFSKPPFEAELMCHDGRCITLIGAHLKSKAPHGARSKDEAMLISIANRRKQLAQALWIRGRVDQVLDNGAEVIVLGDLNDGPGLDVYEELFARSSVEIIMGQSQGPEKQLFDPHAMQMIEKTGADPFSARFYPARDGVPLDALLDYILVGPSFGKQANNWRIWNPHSDPKLRANSALQQALITASDHFPITFDF
jgi:predicted extracellular nuclease